MCPTFASHWGTYFNVPHSYTVNVPHFPTMYSKNIIYFIYIIYKILPYLLYLHYSQDFTRFYLICCIYFIYKIYFIYFIQHKSIRNYSTLIYPMSLQSPLFTDPIQDDCHFHHYYHPQYHNQQSKKFQKNISSRTGDIPLLALFQELS